MISEIYPNNKLYLKYGKEYYGWGVFAKEDMTKDEIVERCYCVLDNFHNSVLRDYVFSMDPNSTDVYHVLGFGAIYNHSDSPNIAPSMGDKETQIIEFRALRDIKKDEELRWNYGKGYWIRKNEDTKKII